MSNNKYIQLCYDERIVIENRLKNGESYTAIAKSLGRSTSTISREVNSFIEEQIQRLPGRKRDKNRRRVNIPAITSLDSRKYRGQVMVSTIRKAKEGVKRRQRLHSKLYSYNAKLAREYAAKRHSGVCRTSKKLTEPIYARTLAYIKTKLRLRWSPEQISLRIDALLADQTLKDNDGWTGDMGLRPISHMAIYRYIYGLNGNERKKAISSLRRRGKPFKNTAKLPYNNTNRGKHSIHDRPASIDNLESYTDLEGDTVFGLDTKDMICQHFSRQLF